MPNFDGTNYNDSIACLNNWVGNDHTVTATVYDDGTDANYEVELLVRWSISAHNAQGYEVDIIANEGAGNYLFVARWNGPHNSFTTIGSTNVNVTVNNGAVWKAVMAGSTLTVYCNGTQVYTQDMQAWAVANGGNYYATGAPGLGFWNQSGGAPVKHLGFSSWSATSP